MVESAVLENFLYVATPSHKTEIYFGQATVTSLGAPAKPSSVGIQ